MMTLLEQLLEKASQLPSEEQEALARRWLQELEDELIWEEKFTATSEEAWGKMAARVERAIENGESEPLEALLAFEENEGL
ncbi:MAG TPA: hypothetical protein ENK60_05445 [Anaerolineae bacterium]|nr:hypothetical protein [Anaerolineae bacterium]